MMLLTSTSAETDQLGIALSERSGRLLDLSHQAGGEGTPTVPSVLFRAIRKVITAAFGLARRYPTRVEEAGGSDGEAGYGS